jgi:hypothetical protein
MPDFTSFPHSFSKPKSRVFCGCHVICIPNYLWTIRHDLISPSNPHRQTYTQFSWLKTQFPSFFSVGKIFAATFWERERRKFNLCVNEAAIRLFRINFHEILMIKIWQALISWIQKLSNHPPVVWVSAAESVNKLTRSLAPFFTL